MTGYRLISRTCFIDRHCLLCGGLQPPRTTDRPELTASLRQLSDSNAAVTGCTTYSHFERPTFNSGNCRY
jgi:hypothetical protein